MDMKKVLDHLPITNSSNENEKPEPIQCDYCGKDKPQLFIDVPLIGHRWVFSACPCETKRNKEFYEEKQKAEDRREINKLLRLSSSYEELKSFTWDNLNIRDGMESSYETVKKAVKEFKTRGKLGVLLFGESGNGKTHLTAAGANELLKQGYSVIFLTEQDLLSRFRETDHYNNEESFTEIMSACMNADLLVWDDFLSTPKLDAKEKKWIFQVVNGRERANKPIWFTSNLTKDEFKSGKYAKTIDDKERTWWRVVVNSDCVFNRASNYRKLLAIARTKGIPIDELEGI